MGEAEGRVLVCAYTVFKPDICAFHSCTRIIIGGDGFKKGFVKVLITLGQNTNIVDFI